MDWVNEHRIGGSDYVWMASTLGGNPISTAAANATLDVFRSDGTYERLHQLGQYLRRALASVLEARGLTAQVIGDGPLAQIVFSDRPVRDHRSTLAADKALARAVMLGLFQRGIFLNPMGTKLYLSIAHDEAVCDELCRRLNDTLEAIAPG